MSPPSERDAHSVAIMGLSCRLPGDGDNLDNFWELICQGRCTYCLRILVPTLENPSLFTMRPLSLQPLSCVYVLSLVIYTVVLLRRLSRTPIKSPGTSGTLQPSARSTFIPPCEPQHSRHPFFSPLPGNFPLVIGGPPLTNVDGTQRRGLKSPRSDSISMHFTHRPRNTIPALPEGDIS